MTKSPNRLIADLINSTGQIEGGVDSSATIDLINANAIDSGLAQGIGMQTFSTLDSLPTTNLEAGDQAYVQANNRIYISNGSGWYNVAVINATPRLTLSSEGTIALSSDGTPTTITMTALDSDNSDANLTLSLESGGDLFKFATVAQDSSVVTITPRSSDSATALGFDGSATLTFKATDGIGIASVVNTFTLSFGPDWTGTTAQHRIPNPDGTAYDYFGIRNDINSDGTRFVVLSSTGGELEVYQGATNSWTQEYKNTEGSMGDANNPGDCAISDDGSIIVAGKPAHSSNTGQLVVRTRSGSTWSNASGSPTLTPSDAATSDRHGISVAISGDGNYIVGGSARDESNTGAAYIYYQGSTHTWAQQAKITATGGTTSEQFGHSCDIDVDGTRVIVGAWKEDTSSNSEDYGAAYIFKRTGTSWAQEARIVSSDIALDDEFGNDVAINSTDGSVAVVGAHLEDTGGDMAGAAYIFKRDGTSWSQDAKIVAGDAAAYDLFGWRVGISADGVHVVVTAPLENTDNGAVYVFKNTGGSTWVQQVKLVQSSRQTGRFGDGVSISENGNIIIAGAYTETATNSNAGAVYVNYLS